MQNVAIIGAGPAGLVTARWLQEEGFRPVLFEQGEHLGGQWCGGAAHSGVWPAMRTNTSRVMSAFSDLDHGPEVPTYPSNQQMRAYLERYARRFGLNEVLRSQSRVVEVAQEGDGWSVGVLAADGSVRREHFGKVVVASGRYNKPRIPATPGLETFSGSGGVLHTFQYRGAAHFQGMRVVVAGGSISALEIASELAMHGVEVIVSQRKQRYILQKIVAGVPVEHRVFTRFAALAGESFPPEVSGRALRDFILATSGNPEQFGAPRPSVNVFEANITQNQNYLPLVAEGRIVPRPAIRSISGRVVEFADGSRAEPDAIVFGTGFDLHLPFLGEDLRHTLGADEEGLDLFAHTLHPALPGLGFAGLFHIAGPSLPTLELQGRWIAAQWSGQRPAIAAEQFAQGLAAARGVRGESPMHALAVMFARLAGVEPDPAEHSDLARALLFGPLSPASFRLRGAHRLDDAPERTHAAAAAFGAIGDGDWTAEQRAQVAALAGAGNDVHLAQLVGSWLEPRRFDAKPAQ